MTHAATDFTRPNVARVYDYLLGGFEALGADREQAARLLTICPSLGIAALENRYFLARAVTWAARQGVTQFVDLGAGAPVQKARAGILEDTHVTAQTAQPACFIFGLALGLVPAALARDVVAGYARRAATGSCIVISCGRCDDQALWDQLREAYTAASAYNHAPGDVEGFLAGLELVPPGLVAAQNWQGGSNDARSTVSGSVYVLAGLARKAQGFR